MSNSSIFCLLHYLYTYALMYHLNNKCIALAYYCIIHSFFPFFAFTTIRTRKFGHGQYARGFRLPHNTAREVRTLSKVRHPELIALYASAPNHVLCQ